METKVIASTKAQNNFGQVIDSVVQNRTRYIVKRRNVSQAIIMSLADFNQLLANSSERQKMSDMIGELAPVYSLGETIGSSVGDEAEVQD